MHSVTHALPCQFQQLPVSAHVDRPVKEVPLETNIHLFGSCANTLKRSQNSTYYVRTSALSSACRHAYRYRFCFVTSQSSLCIIRPSSSHLYLLNNSLMNTADSAVSYPGIPLLKMVTSHLLFAKQHLCHHISKFLSMQFRHHSIFDVLQRQLLSNPSP